MVLDVFGKFGEIEIVFICYLGTTLELNNLGKPFTHCSRVSNFFEGFKDFWGL